MSESARRHEFLAASERAMSERRSAFAKARSIADTYWASFAKAEAAFAKVDREATNRPGAIRENEEAVEKPASLVDAALRG